MIEIIGDSGTSEYSAAEEIKDALCELWPGLASSPRSEEDVKIRASAKISGYGVSDIDVILCAKFQDGRKFVPVGVINDSKGNRVVRKPIVVKNLLVAIEVKDQPEDGVRVSGDSVSVQYTRGGAPKWKNATDQNVDQVHSLKNYCSDLGHELYVHRCLFMRGLAKLRVAGAVASGFDGKQFLTQIAKVSRVRSYSGEYILSSADEDISKVLVAPIFERIIPTSLDRKRMDQITASYVENDSFRDYLGKRMVRIRGRGGVGKTIMLLQSAWKNLEATGRRSIVLTYNKALAADIARSMALMGVNSSPENGGISIRTVMSFVYAWLNKLQVIDADQEQSFDDYEELCLQALDLINAGAISPADIQSIKDESSDKFDFDLIFIDEGQDWPQVEADLIKKLYAPEIMCVADGIDQLVRGAATSWDKGVDDVKLVSLDRCLRLKRNLSVFANEVAKSVGLNWNVKPNKDAGGGRVILLTRPFMEYPDLQSELIEAAKSKGNAEIDFLYCVPSSNIREHEGGRQSKLVHSFISNGYEVWDGTDPLTRKDFPHRLSQLRVVQYASCRGLEGWTVILEGLDDYWSEECSLHVHPADNSDEIPSFVNSGKAASDFAWHKVLIPFTRPIDTLVISLADIDSVCSQALLDLASLLPEIIEVK